MKLSLPNPSPSRYQINAFGCEVHADYPRANETAVIHTKFGTFYDAVCYAPSARPIAAGLFFYAFTLSTAFVVLSLFVSVIRPSCARSEDATTPRGRRGRGNRPPPFPLSLSPLTLSQVRADDAQGDRPRGQQIHNLATARRRTFPPSAERSLSGQPPRHATAGARAFEQPDSALRGLARATPAGCARVRGEGARARGDARAFAVRRVSRDKRFGNLIMATIVVCAVDTVLMADGHGDQGALRKVGGRRRSARSSGPRG